MATDPAPRQLWQLPTFLVGAASLVAMWYGGDRLRPSLPERCERAIQALRPAVDRSPPDPEQVRAALRKVPDGDPPADLFPQMKYLTGSAYVALAEARPTDPEAADWWARALRDLGAAADHDLPANDHKRLRYRLARTWAHTPGADPERTIAALNQFIGAGDDPSEGYRLLADLLLAARPPKEGQGRLALQNFLKHASPRADARTLNEARLRLAELHGKLGEKADELSVLKRIGPDAPPELYAAAQLRLAALYRADGDWGSAEKALQQVREMKGATDAQHDEALARLPEVLAKLGRTQEAEAIASQVGHQAAGPESRPLALQRAELALQSTTAGKDEPVAHLEKALAGVDLAAVRKTMWLADARRVAEAVFQQAQTSGEFALAVRAAAAYAAVAENGADQKLLADAHEAWAAAGSGPDAVDHYRAAAEARARAAAADPDPAGRRDSLRKAADLFVKAGDPKAALGPVKDLVARLKEAPEEQAGRLWFEAGELLQAVGDRPEARQAFHTAAGMTGPFRLPARVRVARLDYEADPEAGGVVAATALQEVVAHPPVVDADKAAHEEAVFLLGEIHLLRKDWSKAETQLRLALEAYPDSPWAARGRYQFGQVLRHGAYEAARKIKGDRAELDQIKAERLTNRQPALKVDQQIALEDRIEKSQKTYEELMRGAFDQFRQAEELLLASPAAGDPAVLRRAGFWAADCGYWLGDFADCAARCEKLAARYAGRVEELEAARDLHRCCVFAAEAARSAKDVDGAVAWARRATDARVRVAEALRRLPPAELDGTADTRKKGYWEAWLADAGGGKGE